MSSKNQHPLYDYVPPEFTPLQLRFLSAAGWSSIEAGDLVDIAEQVLGQRPPEIERATYLTRELLRQGCFQSRRLAYSFATAYVELVDRDTDFRLLVWDWE